MEIIIKMDREELVKVKTSSIYGELHPDDEPHPINEVIQNLNAQIQDLKLENDRLKQREEIMLQFLKSAKCDGISCSDCLFFNDTYPIGRKCAYNRNSIFSEISNKATKILEQMEDLG